MAKFAFGLDGALMAADDAVVIDSTNLGEDEVLAQVEELAVSILQKIVSSSCCFLPSSCLKSRSKNHRSNLLILSNQRLADFDLQPIRLKS